MCGHDVSKLAGGRAVLALAVLLGIALVVLAFAVPAYLTCESRDRRDADLAAMGMRFVDGAVVPIGGDE
jgi:hypothetical protein